MSIESPLNFHSAFHPVKTSDGPSIGISNPEVWAQTIKKRTQDRMNRNAPQETKTERPYWLLEGTGFDVRGQVDKLLRDLVLGSLKGQDRSQVIKGWVGQTVQDILGYDLEYLKGEKEGSTVFPILLGIKQVDGERRIVGREYNDQLWTSTILPQERNRAVEDSVQKIERFILNGNNGDIAFMVSPPEWSGLISRDGKPIVFPDAQIYIVQKLEGEKINAMTLRLDMTVEQCEKVLKKMEVELPKGLDRHQKIEQIVRSTIFKGASKGKVTVDNLIDVLEEVKGIKGAYKGSSFDDMRRDKDRFEELLKMDGKVKEIIEEFTEFSSKNLDGISDETREALEKALGETLLKLTIFEKKISIPSLSFGNGPELPKGFASMNMLVALKTMQSIGGCAGGGNITGVVGGFTTRVGLLPGAAGEDWRGSLNFECPTCHATNIRPWGEVIPNCLHCNADVSC